LKLLNESPRRRRVGGRGGIAHNAGVSAAGFGKTGTKNKLYNPITAEANHQRARMRQSPKLKMTDEIWEIIKPKLENWGTCGKRGKSGVKTRKRLKREVKSVR
jgi:hypothetical protein